jgi:hypothetical protein
MAAGVTCKATKVVLPSPARQRFAEDTSIQVVPGDLGTCGDETDARIPPFDAVALEGQPPDTVAEAETETLMLA